MIFKTYKITFSNSLAVIVSAADLRTAVKATMDTYASSTIQSCIEIQNTVVIQGQFQAN